MIGELLTLTSDEVNWGMDKEQLSPPIEELNHVGPSKEKSKEIDQRRQFLVDIVAEMHRLAYVYEKESMKLFLDGEIHKGHVAMDNAKSLRISANILDPTAANGG